MKGILKKTEEGWFVIYDQRTMQDPSAEEGILPLHPEDQCILPLDLDLNGKEVEFEINMYDGKSHISNAWNGYAKLIDKSDRSCNHTNCREICPECKLPSDILENVISSQPDWNEEPLNPFSEDFEKVCEAGKNIELVGQNDELQFIKKQLENIEYYKLGYNVAQKKLYTKEEMELCWIAAMSNRAGFSDSISYKDFIKSLKKD